MAITKELYEFIMKVVEDKVSEIKVTREEFDKLSLEVRTLAQNVNKLTENITMLTERLDRLTERVDKLAEAQVRTEDAISSLAKLVSGLTVSVGALADSIGFGLEDIAKVVVPGWLERHEGIRVEGLDRRVFVVHGFDVEIDLYGEGFKGREPIVILGDVKSRFYSGEVEKFVRKLDRLEAFLAGKVVYKLIFGFYIHPSAEAVCRVHGIASIASYMR